MPASTRRRRRRGSGWRWAIGLFAVAGLAGVLALAVLAFRPGLRARVVRIARMGLGRAEQMKESYERSRPRPVPELRCVEARTVGAAGEVLPIDRLPDGTTATALFLWSDADDAAAAELRALRAAMGESVRELPGSPRAAVLTADAARLRAALRVAPSADARLGAAGTRELCYVAA